MRELAVTGVVNGLAAGQIWYLKCNTHVGFPSIFASSQFDGIKVVGSSSHQGRLCVLRKTAATRSCGGLQPLYTLLFLSKRAGGKFAARPRTPYVMFLRRDFAKHDGRDLSRLLENL